MELGPTLMTSFRLNDLPILKHNCTEGVRALTYAFGGDTIQSITPLTPLGLAYLKRRMILSVVGNIEGLEPLCSAGGSAWFHSYMPREQSA